MTYYAVIDTNVIVSSILKHNSIPGIIVDLCFSGIIIPLLNKEIVDEYKEVVTYSHHLNKFVLKWELLAQEL